jgi:hypothetical protein
MKRSSIKEILKHLQKPGMISFAGELPAPETFRQSGCLVYRKLINNFNRVLFFFYMASLITLCAPLPVGKLKVTQRQKPYTNGTQKEIN